MSNKKDQSWFEMKDVRRRLYANASWVPLRVFEEKKYEDDTKEVIAIGSVAVLNAYRNLGDKLRWHEVGVGHDGGPYAFSDGRYKNAESFLHNERIIIGADLVFVQHIGGSVKNIWHINQDLIIALGLIEEGDVWVRPSEGHITVLRTRKDEFGRIFSIEIKTEFLVDYLAARNMSLRLSYFRERSATCDDISHIDWGDDGCVEESDNEKFEARIAKLGPDGWPIGGVAVFEAWRTDVDDEEDVPVFGPESDKNTSHRSFVYERSGPLSYRVDGSFWRDEWIESAAVSERVRGDEPNTTQEFIIDASGKKELSKNLKYEEVGRYLWFKPQIINEILSIRGSSLGWYTANTGYISFFDDWTTHFGVNNVGLINIYAYDIAKIENWKQRIWAGQNVAPDGAVSAELLASQQRSRPANTIAPEETLASAMERLNQITYSWKGFFVFSEHDAASDILRNVHRFRAVDVRGLLSLAKDIARLTADRIDASSIQKFVPPPKGERWGGIKSLEKLVATVVPAVEARAMLSPIVGAYELRLGDAHLPSSRIKDAMTLVGIDESDSMIGQGKKLIEAVAISFEKICDVIQTASKN